MIIADRNRDEMEKKTLSSPTDSSIGTSELLRSDCGNMKMARRTTSWESMKGRKIEEVRSWTTLEVDIADMHVVGPVLVNSSIGDDLRAWADTVAKEAGH